MEKKKILDFESPVVRLVYQLHYPSSILSTCGGILKWILEKSEVILWLEFKWFMNGESAELL
jgi:hypothetical protein